MSDQHETFQCQRQLCGGHCPCNRPVSWIESQCSFSEKQKTLMRERHRIAKHKESSDDHRSADLSDETV